MSTAYYIDNNNHINYSIVDDFVIINFLHFDDAVAYVRPLEKIWNMLEVQ